MFKFLFEEFKLDLVYSFKKGYLISLVRICVTWGRMCLFNGKGELNYDIPIFTQITQV
jgi:hypothetical protein